MKANRKTIWNNDDRAQVGIGTMIVFIATILVAATAAAVLVDTSGKLQERSSATGNEATKQVASNLVVRGIYGDIDDNTANKTLALLNITVSLAPGAAPMDLAQMKIKYATDDHVAELDHRDEHKTNYLDDFVVAEIRDPKGTMDPAPSPFAWVISPGGLANIEINLERVHYNEDFTVSPRDVISVMLIPEIGAPVYADFTAPPSFGTDDIVVLR